MTGGGLKRGKPYASVLRREILKSALAERLYEAAAALPVIDYHCHLSPKEIYEDKPFEDIGAMWLSGDHYKWRLMRRAGVSEELITGGAPYADKFRAYAGCVGTAFGNPLRDWSRLELEKYFDCRIPLNADNADGIRRAANAVLAEKALSPRRLMEASAVEYVATTDDPADTLDYHTKLRKDKSFKCKVAPTFRVDSLFNIDRADFAAYIERLSAASGVEINGFADFLSAIGKRMTDFLSAGCRFSDIGTERFPLSAGSYESAEAAFNNAKNGIKSCECEIEGYFGFMYTHWLCKCKEYGFAAQLHLNVLRNTNGKEFLRFGADGGFDTVSDGFSARAFIGVLNRCDAAGGLPRIIVYTLNPAYYEALITAAGSFREVTVGMAWWFNDHQMGIREYLDKMSALSHIGEVIGMLTDSRSFLSYARHDWFRMILADFLSAFGEENEKELTALAEKLSYYNTKKLIEG
ncbi:MAG: glucuronate isomerase [Clostridiaceae bacterium]|jgi:glucuronate isomerase|nr:glucuronate isomerase [Clostridiaceae bacterium]